MSKIKILLILGIVFLSTCLVQAQTWNNPLVLPEEWNLYGIGDPYLLKYKGEYYLYCSTRDDMTGVKCWSSRDLVNWNYQGLATTESVTKGAYAPEVIYYDGKFYMYTSPAGNGHYVLKADAPTGPFTLATGNVGNSIDGSVFIEDDGSMYFYRAGSSGIFGHSMSSPTNIGSPVQINAYMNGWTEAPCVIKRNGIYYMQYTGNHVISPGYRINHGRSSTGPLEGFSPIDELNPYIVCSEGDVQSLGHGSLFIGPDLDSYYITYHNKVRSYSTGPLRHVNFDRIAWNGELILAMGPTTFSKPVPEMPDFYDYFDANSIGDTWQTIAGSWQIMDGVLIQDNLSGTTDDLLLISDEPAASYTAEFNLQTINSNGSDSYNGVVFNYIDDNNYGRVILNANANTIEINTKVSGVWGSPIVQSIANVVDISKWNTIRIEKNLDQVKVFMNNMLKAEVASTSTEGKLGLISYASETHYDFCAFSNKINGSGVYDAYKPVPGRVEAIHYNQTNGYNEVNPTGTVNFRHDNAKVTAIGQGRYALGMASVGNWYDYNLNAEYAGKYVIGIKYAAVAECTVSLSTSEGKLCDDIILPATGGGFKTVVTEPISLGQGFNTVKLTIEAGQAAFYHFKYEQQESVESYSDSFTSVYNNWNYEDGTWLIEDKTALVDGTGKRTVGSINLSDYAVEVDVKYNNGTNAGLIFRVKNPAQGGIGDDPQLGADFLQGYYVNITSTGASLGKHNYNWQGLANYSGTTHNIGQWYHLKAEVRGANIKIYIDDMDHPVIDYTDADPFITGKVGLRSYYTNANFDNFTIYDINSESSVLNEDVCYSIISCYSDNVIAVNPTNSNEITQAVLDENDPYQQWKFKKASSYWSIINKGSGKYLTINDLDAVITSSYAQQKQFFWNVNEVEVGKYSIVNLDSGESLMLAEGESNAGTSILQGAYSGLEEQKWKFNYLFRDDVSTAINQPSISSSSIVVSPNPARNFFEITSEQPIQSIKVFDVNGIFIQQYLVENLNAYSVSCTDYTKGVYVIWVITEVGDDKQRLVII
ncbi:family 43 glycosylhydrolase [Carboxylicivirga caseinilyticus]|uniref:family 43 glycosylhydrolase n=1 Tax=Carboxylicivirga caseinilyticus TaxID=3417572 RepID=UPI003D33C8A9|nr:family 43 glycosylhydrolase [Marinilabiliaceae bacterium A049]